MKNPHWPRWIFANVVRHFTNVSQRINMPLYLDRYDRDTDWVELRIGGPYVSQPSKSWYNIDYNIDILITTYQKNWAYKIHELTGIYASEFQEICIYRLGDGEDDDHGLAGVLKLKDNPVNIHNFSLVLPEAKFMRSSVESDFWFDYVNR